MEGWSLGLLSAMFSLELEFSQLYSLNVILQTKHNLQKFPGRHINIIYASISI